MAETWHVDLVSVADKYEVKPCWTHNLSSVWLLFSLAIFDDFLKNVFFSKIYAQRGA